MEVPVLCDQTVTPVAAARSPRAVGSGEVVDFLIRRQHWLTALELLHELTEAGEDPVEVSKLTRVFADPAQFPCDKIKLCEDTDVDSHKALLKQRDEQISMLEYELSLAREDLLESQQQHVDDMAAAREGGVGSGAHLNLTPVNSEALYRGPSEIERKLLNYSVKQYLVSRGYKLTALTFCDEVASQNLDLWLGGGNPPHEPLWSLFLCATDRGGGLQTAGIQALERKLGELSEEVDDLTKSLAKERQHALEARSQASKAMDETNRLQGDVAELTQQLRDARAKLNQQAASSGSTADVDSVSNGIGSGHGDLRKPNHHQDAQFNGVEAAAKASEREALRAVIRKEMQAELGSPLAPNELAVTTIVGEALPRIVPNVLIQKREELLPVFLAVVKQHPDPAVRDNLANNLFNLIKKPNAMQRKTIMEGYVALATAAGPQRTAEELLPQCWGQIDHKYPERRALVADSCGLLAAYVCADLRGSLILSILQQLFDDNSPLVREAATRNLALLLPLIPNHDKYSTVQSACVQLATDCAEEVAAALLTQVVPALTAWLLHTDLLHAKLLPTLTTTTVAMLRESPRADNCYKVSGADPRAPAAHDRVKILAMLRMLEALFPHLRRLILRQRDTGVNAQLLEESSPDYEADNAGDRKSAPSQLPPLQVDNDADLVAIYQGANGDLAAVDWVLRAGIYSLCNVACLLDPKDKTLRMALCKATRALCRVCGEGFCCAAVAPLFAAHAYVWEAACAGDGPNSEQGPNRHHQSPPGAEGNRAEALQETAKRWPLGSEAIIPQVMPILKQVLAESPPIDALYQAPVDDVEPTKPGKLLWTHGPFLCVLPVLLAGVLPCAGTGAMPTFLEYVLEGLVALGPPERRRGGVSQEILEAVGFAGSFEDMQDSLLSTICKMVVNPEDGVRASIGGLLGTLTGCVTPARITRHILPGLVTLGVDPALDVRVKVAAAYGAVARYAGEEEAAGKVSNQLDLFLEDGNQAMTVAVIRAIAAAVPHCPSTSLLEWSADKVYTLAKANTQSSLLQFGEAGLARRKECAAALFDAVQAISALEHVGSVQAQVVPTLEKLIQGDDLLDEATKYMCNAMLKERGRQSEDDVTSDAPTQGRMSSMLNKFRSGPTKQSDAPIVPPVETIQAPKVPEVIVETSAPSEGAATGWRGRMANKFKFKKGDQ